MNIVKRYGFLILSLISFCLFLVFTFVVKKRLLVTFDFDTTVRIQDKIPRNMDMFLSWFSIIGSFEILTLILIFLLILTRKMMGIVVLVMFFGAHVLELFGKIYLTHPGPPFQFFRYDLGFLFPSSYVQTGSSYPSGHSMRTVIITSVLLFLIIRTKHFSFGVKSVFVLVIGFLTGIMLVSRISLGEHWTTDVVGGALLALSVGWMTCFLLNNSSPVTWFSKHSTKRQHNRRGGSGTEGSMHAPTHQSQ